MAATQPNVRWFNNVIPTGCKALFTMQLDPPAGEGSKNGETKG